MRHTPDGREPGAGRSDAPVAAGGRRARSSARIAWVGAAFVVLAGIAYLSLVPVWDPDFPGPFDQLPHAVAYAVLTAVLLAILPPRSSTDTPWAGAIALGLSLIIFGSLMELAQAVVGRDVESADAIANAVGVGVALAVWYVLRRTRTGTSPTVTTTGPAHDA